MTPKPHKKRGDEINEAVKNLKVNLAALYSGGDPSRILLYKNLYKKRKRSHFNEGWRH